LVRFFGMGEADVVSNVRTQLSSFRALIAARDKQIEDLRNSISVQEESYRQSLSLKDRELEDLTQRFIETVSNKKAPADAKNQLIESLRRQLSEATALARQNGVAQRPNENLKKTLEKHQFEFERERMRWNEDYQQLEDENAELRDEIKNYEERFQQVERFAEQAKECDRLREENEQLRLQLQESVDDMGEIRRLEIRLNDADSALHEKDSTMRDLEMSIMALRQKAAQADDLKKQVKEQDAQIDNLLKKLQTAAEDLHMAQEEINALRDDLERREGGPPHTPRSAPMQPPPLTLSKPSQRSPAQFSQSQSQTSAPPSPAGSQRGALALSRKTEVEIDRLRSRIKELESENASIRAMMEGESTILRARIRELEVSEKRSAPTSLAATVPYGRLSPSNNHSNNMMPPKTGQSPELSGMRERIRDLEQEVAMLQRQNEAIKAQSSVLAHAVPHVLPFAMTPNAPNHSPKGSTRSSAVGRSAAAASNSSSQSSPINIFREHLSACTYSLTGKHTDIGFMHLVGCGRLEGECWVQWYRSQNGRSFDAIPGALSPSYVPTADDVSCVLRLECTPVGHGSSHSNPLTADTFRIELDSHMEKVVRSFVKAGRAAFMVLVTGTVADEQRTLIVEKKLITIVNKADNTEPLAYPYNLHMTVDLDPGPVPSFTLQVDMDRSFSMKTATFLDRDVVAHTIRQFISISKERTLMIPSNNPSHMTPTSAQSSMNGVSRTKSLLRSKLS